MASKKAVLFDLDGTLIHTEPDLVKALRCLRSDLGLRPDRHPPLRDVISNGARSILAAGLADQPDIGISQDLIDRFLHWYEAAPYKDSHPFDGIDEVLACCEQRNIGLGVVTNKAEHLALRVLEGAGWSHRFGVLVGGDSLATSKPDPEGVWHACRMLGVEPSDALLVGDDERDLLAAQAAGVGAVVAQWGYGLKAIGSSDDIIYAQCPRPTDLAAVIDDWCS